MAMSSSNPQTYMTQWLETATKGKVVAHFSMMNNRMRLKCMECDSTLTVPEPEGTTIDFGVQEFVKLHAHKPGSWVCYQCGKMIEGSLTEHAVECSPSAWQAKTADFKPLGQIDEKPEKAAKIVAQTQQYDAEMQAKLSSKDFASKIAALQSEGAAKYPAGNWGDLPAKHPLPVAPKTWQGMKTPVGIGKVIPIDIKSLEESNPAEDADWSEDTQIEKALSKKKAIENALKIKLLQSQLTELQNKQVVNHTPGPKLKPTPPAGDGGFEVLKPKEGRKFR